MTLPRRAVLLALAIAGLLLAMNAQIANATSVSRSTLASTAGAVCDETAHRLAGQAQVVHHAGLVIVFGNDRTESLCIEFADDEISGVELLQRSGLPVVYSGFGGLGAGVCRIDDVGCANPGDCFCQCRGADCQSWTYLALEDGAWEHQRFGASTRRLRDGDVDAWVWGSGGDAPASARGPCPRTPAATTTPSPDSSQAAPLPRRTEAIRGSGVTQPSFAGNDAPPAVAATPTVDATPQVRRGDPVVGDGVRAGPRSAEEVDESRGPPAGLIAFGAIAGALLTGVGAVALRRRLHD